MDPNLSLKKICLGDDVVVISNDKVEGPGDWNSPEYQDTAVSKGNKVINTLSFYRMETDKISERYIAPCFVNVKKGKELVKKELIVALKGELYFVKFIINPEEDDSEPGVILGRSFLRLAHGVVDFDNGVITIYPEPDLDPFEDDYEKTGKSSDDWDQLLDFIFDNVPKFGEELPPFISMMGKNNHIKKRTIENLNLFYQDIRPSLSARSHLTQEEAEKEALARDKVELDGKTVKEEEDAVKRIKGESLKEKDDPGAFIFPIRLERKVNENADINTMPYQIYEMLGREEMKKIDRGITMINHTQAEAMGKLSNVLCQVGVNTIIENFIILDIPIDRDAPIMVGRGFLYTMGSILNTSDRLFSTFNGSKKIIRFKLGGRAHNLTLLEFARRFGLYQVTELEEEGFNVYFEGEDPQPGVPRVGIPRPPRASMQDLYDRLGRMKILQEAIEHMEYRQSYH
uniref:Uncharacterized protein n=1 Tax=Tanacetum cinerariifolium TaxID=118510 RepID=A0A6L2P940_TANCI|nr:hypothetical protein [Tanacetum cinerariifolium]